MWRASCFTLSDLPNRLIIQDRQENVNHTKVIVEALRNGQAPEYDERDVRMEDLARASVDVEAWSKVEEGQKFELIDPFAVKFRQTRAATVQRKCESNGLIVVCIDGRDPAKDSFPIHLTSCSQSSTPINLK